MEQINIEKIIKYLSEYDGETLSLMEVCGTHTAAIFKGGIRDLISPKIKLISGPGCPVCVTPTEYIDKCIEFANREKHILLTFGDMLKVPGSKGNLSRAKGEGASVEIMYSPFEGIKKAEENKDVTYVIAGVGFETTAPIYGLVVKEAEARGLENLKILTALKTIEKPLRWICENTRGDYRIDGFICPGHVSTIIGSKFYDVLAKEYKKPFVVAGFSEEHILAAIYSIVRQIEDGRFEAVNLYKNAVQDLGNLKAQAVLDEVYKLGNATWRGMGAIEDSGLYLKTEFEKFDGGSFALDKDEKLSEGCLCKEVIIGKITPEECPMFRKVCTPLNPMGPCMVSEEGACGIWYRN